VNARKSGDVVSLRIARDGAQQTIPVGVQETPGTSAEDIGTRLWHWRDNLGLPDKLDEEIAKLRGEFRNDLEALKKDVNELRSRIAKEQP
jgi:hypothetical protein